jgi:hypothetical protein
LVLQRKVGVETTWVMMWVMTWATGMMAATTLAMMLTKGMVGTLAGRGGRLLAENPVVAAAAALAGVALAVEVTAALAAAYCRGCLLFIGKIFLCGIFMCGENWQGHTSPHNLIMLEVCRRTLGWGR